MKLTGRACEASRGVARVTLRLGDQARFRLEVGVFDALRDWLLGDVRVEIKLLARRDHGGYQSMQEMRSLKVDLSVKVDPSTIALENIVTR